MSDQIQEKASGVYTSKHVAAAAVGSAAAAVTIMKGAEYIMKGSSFDFKGGIMQVYTTFKSVEPVLLTLMLKG